MIFKTKINDAIKLFNSVSKSYKIINIDKINFSKIDSLDIFNLISSFEEIFIDNHISFGNTEKEIKKIFKSKKSLIQHIKKHEK